MRILVTGGAGFIGKHLCRRLMSEGHDVWSMDTAYLDNDEDECRHSTDQLTGAQVIPENVSSVWDRTAWWPATKFDRIYSLACDASPKRYQEYPDETSLTCFNGTNNALNRAFVDSSFHKGLLCRILLASTSEIYGEPLEHPQKESLRTHINPTGPRSCYDLGKAMAECLMMDYHRQYGVDTRIARIFNTYGPLMDFDDGRVISNFVTQALKGEPLTIYGDGSQTRSFCYVDDMVEGLIRLMEYEGSDCHEPHNLGNPSEISVKWLAWHVQAETDPNAPINRVNQELPQDDPTRRCPDITRAKQNLGWEPRVGLSEGLKRTVEDFRSRLCATTSP